eukprot:1820163-Rhodomonas_salina.3
MSAFRSPHVRAVLRAHPDTSCDTPHHVSPRAHHVTRSPWRGPHVTAHVDRTRDLDHSVDSARSPCQGVLSLTAGKLTQRVTDVILNPLLVGIHQPETNNCHDPTSRRFVTPSLTGSCPTRIFKAEIQLAPSPTTSPTLPSAAGDSESEPRTRRPSSECTHAHSTQAQACAIPVRVHLLPAQTNRPPSLLPLPAFPCLCTLPPNQGSPLGASASCPPSPAHQGYISNSDSERAEESRSERPTTVADDEDR